MNASPKVLSDNLILYTNSYFENTAKVSLPSAALPKGKIVVQLGQPRNSAGFVSRDLLDAADNFAVSAPTAKVSYPLDAASQINATDNQLIRLQDGSLLASKNGYIWSDLSPKPAWFDTTSIAVGGVTTGRARNAVFIFRSTDGGVSWVLLSFIDSAVVEGGKYGWPQPGSTPGTFGVGGFDRTELYQDPWSGDIFVSGHGDGGPYTLRGKTTENHAGVIFRSQNNGMTWKTFHVFKDSANQTKGAAPSVMTSTAQQASAIMGAFVQDDLVDSNDGMQAPCTLFYWIDAAPKTDPAASNKLTARYQVVYSGGSFPAGDLSVSSGAKRTFSRVGIGDYFS